MKSYTTILQSKKLAGILPLESADMWYGNEDPYKIAVGKWKDNEHDEDDVPCWSLAALLGVLPKSLIYTPNQALDGYCCKNIMHDLETYGDNPVDACVDMIVKLHEQNLL